MGIGLAIMAAGTVVSAFGAASANRAERRARKQQAKFLALQAEAEIKASEREADTFQRESEIALSDAVSSFAKGGIDIASGSPLMLASRGAAQAKNDKEVILLEGRQRAQGLQFQASSQRAAARSLGRSGPLEVAGGLLSGAGSIVDKLPKAST